MKTRISPSDMDINPTPLDVLVIAPHPDDAELGMGGALLKMIAAGWRVGVLDLTNGEPTPHGTPEIRAAETEAATAVLKLAWRWNLGLTNRELQADLDSRHRLANVIRLTRPRILFSPYWVDAHPDHVAATQLVDDARFWAKLTKTEMLGEPHYPARVVHYYCVHLRAVPQPAFVLDISAEFETKMKAIESYQSQFVAGRTTEPPTFLDQLRLESAYWGKSIGRRYGEPFAVRETLGLETLLGLI